ncbi:MAG: hypothetical protein FWF59_00400 [Turicibacter sp.]|nr:hypothetical protein [Turicibacter sp.]
MSEHSLRNAESLWVAELKVYINRSKSGARQVVYAYFPWQVKLAEELLAEKNIPFKIYDWEWYHAIVMNPPDQKIKPMTLKQLKRYPQIWAEIGCLERVSGAVFREPGCGWHGFGKKRDRLKRSSATSPTPTFGKCWSFGIFGNFGGGKSPKHMGKSFSYV